MVNKVTVFYYSKCCGQFDGNIGLDDIEYIIRKGMDLFKRDSYHNIEYYTDEKENKLIFENRKHKNNTHIVYSPPIIIKEEILINKDAVSFQ